ncbi:hypothetical protein JCM3766R1_003909 [Sporobolomyces carnicolor]
MPSLDRSQSAAAADHHQPAGRETLSSASTTTDSAPTSTVTPETSSTSAPPQSTVQPTNAQHTSATASTEKATPAPSAGATDSTSESASTGAAKDEAAASAGEGAASGSSAQTEYPPQMHAGKAGLGPHYNDGSGFADQVKAKGEILKGKLTHNPELVEQGHQRQSGQLAAQARQADINNDDDSPFARADDGDAAKKPENPKAEDVEDSGREAKTAAATSGTKSN